MKFDLTKGNVDTMKLDVVVEGGRPLKYLVMYEKGDSRVEKLRVSPALTKKKFRELRDSSRVALIGFGHHERTRDAFYQAFTEMDRVISGLEKTPKSL